jgi:hypothetical protein
MRKKANRTTVQYDDVVIVYVLFVLLFLHVHVWQWNVSPQQEE